MAHIHICSTIGRWLPQSFWPLKAHFCKSQYSQSPDRVIAIEGQSGQLRVMKGSAQAFSVPCTLPYLSQSTPAAEKANHFFSDLLHCWLRTCMTALSASEEQPDAWLDIVIMSLCLKPILKLRSRNLTLQCWKKVPSLFPCYAGKWMSSATPLIFWKGMGVWMWPFISKGMCWIEPSHDFWNIILNFSWDVFGWTISSYKFQRKALYYL